MSRPRVTAQMLGNYIGKRVTLVGKVTEINPSRTSIEIDTSEDIKINASHPDGFEGAMVGGIIEVHGTANSKTTIAVDTFVVFNKKDAEQFVQCQYNEFLTIRNFKLGQSQYLQDAYGTDQ